MQIQVKKFSLDLSENVLDWEGNITTNLPPVDSKYILLVDHIHVKERESGAEYDEQWYQVQICTENCRILADLPVRYDFASVGHWTWVDAKASILSQLNLVEYIGE